VSRGPGKRFTPPMPFNGPAIWLNVLLQGLGPFLRAHVLALLPWEIRIQG